MTPRPRKQAVPEAQAAPEGEVVPVEEETVEAIPARNITIARSVPALPIELRRAFEGRDPIYGVVAPEDRSSFYVFALERNLQLVSWVPRNTSQRFADALCTNEVDLKIALEALSNVGFPREVLKEVIPAALAACEEEIQRIADLIHRDEPKVESTR